MEKMIILKKYGNVITVQMVQVIIVQRQAMKLASSKISSSYDKY